MQKFNFRGIIQIKGEFRGGLVKLVKYNDVQFSVQRDGFVGEFGPAKVSPHLIPLHVFI